MPTEDLGIELREPLITYFQNPEGEEENESENKSKFSHSKDKIGGSFTRICFFIHL